MITWLRGNQINAEVMRGIGNQFMFDTAQVTTTQLLVALGNSNAHYVIAKQNTRGDNRIQRLSDHRLTVQTLTRHYATD